MILNINASIFHFKWRICIRKIKYMISVHSAALVLNQPLSYWDVLAMFVPHT